MDIGKCKVENPKQKKPPVCSKANIPLPYLSPTLQTVKTAKDLSEFFKRYYTVPPRPTGSDAQDVNEDERFDGSRADL